MACIQIDPEKGSQSEILDRSLELGREAAEGGVDLIVLPEQWLGPQDWPRAMEKWRNFAGEMEIDVVPGANLLERANSVQIVGIVIGSAGSVLGRQAKVYPYGHEIGTVKAGSEVGVFETPRGYRLGLVICHGVVYPEVVRSLAIEGADVIINPSKIRSKGVPPWHIYLKARALENRLPIVGVNCATAQYSGGSLAIDLKEEGRIVHPVERVKAGKVEGVEVGELNLESARRLRKERLTRVKADLKVRHWKPAEKT